MSKINWSKNGFIIDGNPAPMISGEFHYFRVPERDWKERLTLFKKIGGNIVATYIPWLITSRQRGIFARAMFPADGLRRFWSCAVSWEYM